MTKKIFTILCILLMAGGNRMAVFASGDSLRLGNSSDNRALYEGGGSDGRMGAACFLPESTMALCKGSQITDLALMIGRKGATDITLFITTDLKKETFDYEQVVNTYTAGKWTSVKLDKPFDVQGESLFIGYRMSGEGSNMLFTTPYIKGEEYVLVNGEWIRYEKNYAAGVYAIVRGQHLPHHWASLTSAQMKLYTDSTTPLTFTGQVQNNGIDTIRSLQLSYTINNVEAGVLTIDELNVANRSKGTFTVELPLLQEGYHDIRFSLSKLNGEHANSEVVSHQSKVFPVICSNHFVARSPLVEMFSTELCPQCPAGHLNVEEAIEECSSPERVSMITHHAAFYSDRYTIPASVEYEWFYGEHQLYAPSVMFDRSDFSADYGYLFDGKIPIIGVTKMYVKQLLEEALSIPAYATVNLSIKELSKTRELSIQVSGKELLPTGENPRLFVFLTEDDIFSTNQAGSGGEYIHHTVARQCLSDAWGDEISLKDGYEKNYTTIIPDSLNAKNMKVVAFVANVDKDNRLNCMVYNSANAPIPLSPDGIFHTDRQPKVTAVVQGKELLLSMPCAQVLIHSSDGVCRQVVSDCHTVSLDKLPSGLYIATLVTSQGVETQKIRVR